MRWVGKERRRTHGLYKGSQVWYLIKICSQSGITGFIESVDKKTDKIWLNFVKILNFIFILFELDRKTKLFCVFDPVRKFGFHWIMNPDCNRIWSGVLLKKNDAQSGCDAKLLEVSVCCTPQLDHCSLTHMPSGLRRFGVLSSRVHCTQGKLCSRFTFSIQP